MAEPATAVNKARGATGRPSPPGEKPRRPARYLWAMLLARIYAPFPLVCSRCGGEVEIIAFITEEPTAWVILTHLGEPGQPPSLSTCRGPPTWEMFDQAVEFDPIHPEPEYEFDQTVSW